MRVIGGRCRGMRLQPVPGTTTRPTADRVKESLFNILAPWVADARVLDLFAGTGALGIEALSRGAREAVFVERDAQALRVLRANLRHTKLEELAEIRAGDVARELLRLGSQGRAFDLVFLDPPYRQGLVPPTLASLAANGLVAPGGWIVVEHDGREEMPEQAANLARVRTVRYGDTALTFFRPGDDHTAPDDTPAAASPTDPQETGGHEGGR
ncbi:MAG: 16S rRNA (guanine(966)-N(2))-methyltransferase RsmD [Firmicutes bacterium ZCTH02-B6]|nr:MAG: 16S rRNA (guanine(966)-N(2))-methyltransferase RsmD [Firmicutes bacterium ZCTH02-B6]